MGAVVIPGSGHVAAELDNSVRTDGNTIGGNGTTVPLFAFGGGGGVATDDTLTGNGLGGTPLSVDTANISGDVAVAVDGTSVGGNGTTGSPLHVIGGGATVVTDNTLTGDGSGGDPLGVDITNIAVDLAGDVSSAVDGTTIAGNGKTATPLHVVPAGLDHNIAVVDDGTTIAGTGKTGSPLHVVPAGLDNTVAVAADGTTIGGTGKTGSTLHVIPGGLNGQVGVAVDSTLTGNGTTGNPLHVVASGATPGVFQASFTGFGTPIPGMPVSISGVAPGGGAITTVTGAQPGNLVVGVITAVGATMTVQSLGLVTLSEAQWSAARGGGSGGLSTGEIFYLSAGSVLDDVAPDTLDSYSIAVGMALSSTIMALSCPAVPIRITTAVANCNGQSVGGGFVSSRGFSSFVRTNTGRYSLTLAGDPPTDDNCIPVVTLATNSSVGIAVATTVVAGVVEVFISAEPGGAGIDANFYVTVTAL